MSSTAHGGEPEIAVLYCRRCLAAGVDPARGPAPAHGFRVKLAMMPCTSKIEVSHLVAVLAGGVDGVQVVGCRAEACQFQVGSLMAEKRVERARSLLRQIGLEAERVAMERAGGLGVEDLVAAAGRRAEAVRSMGPNPMRSAR